MQTNDQLFLKKWNELENYIDKNTNSNSSFKNKILELKKDNYSIRRYEEEIYDLYNIRNIVAHRVGSPIYATPNDFTLKRIEEITENIITKKLLISVVNNKPLTFEINRTIVEILKVIQEKDYSQFPIYSNKQYQGLLTTNALMRWYASQVSAEGEVIHDLNSFSIEEVLSFTEENEVPKFVSRQTTLNEFLVLLDFTPNIKTWIITETGDKNQNPLSIITEFDYAHIYKQIQ